MEEGVLIADSQVKKPDASDRMRICKNCPLFIKDSNVCNPYLWMNPTTKEVSKYEKGGFIKGCGCYLTRKVQQPNSHCHLGLW